jgi:hypothetical protein
MFVKSGSCTSNPSPVTTTYNESAGCANVYVSGTYSADLTIAAANDNHHRADGPRSTNNGNLVRSGAASLGLIAERYVRVWHPVTDTGSCYSEQHARPDHREDRRPRSCPCSTRSSSTTTTRATTSANLNGQRRHRPEVPRHGRHLRRRLRRQRLQQGLQLRRPVPLPEPPSFLDR